MHDLPADWQVIAPTSRAIGDCRLAIGNWQLASEVSQSKIDTVVITDWLSLIAKLFNDNTKTSRRSSAYRL